MDARERLRRYLEQRRELGERDLVLDGMSVDEVMRIVGAPAAAESRSGGASNDRGSGGDAPRPSARPTGAGRAAPSPPDPGDWRSVLRAAEEAPESIRELAREGPEHRAERPAEPTPPRTRERPSDAQGLGTGEGTSASSTKALDLPPLGIVVGSAARDLFGGPFANLSTIDDVARAVASCTRCPLYATATNPVPGEGSPTAELVCVGEAPGATEDATGRPFVGQAGQLLTKILAAINLRREDVFICNVLKHRPPGNRNPLPEEVKACSPYLVRQLELIRPKVVVAFGTFAAQTLLDTKLSIGKLRGVMHKYYGVPLIVTYHPAALLRNPAWKRPTWEDVQLARRILDRAADA